MGRQDPQHRHQPSGRPPASRLRRRRWRLQRSKGCCLLFPLAAASSRSRVQPRAAGHSTAPPLPPPPLSPRRSFHHFFPCYYKFALTPVSQANPGQQWSVFSLRSVLSRLQARQAPSLQTKYQPDRRSARAPGGQAGYLQLVMCARLLLSCPEQMAVASYAAH